MAPAFVLIERQVRIRNHPLQPRRPSPRATAKAVVGRTTTTSSVPLGLDSMEAAFARYMRTTEPNLKVVDPPGVSRLTIIRPLSSDPFSKYRADETSTWVAAADKNLIVLYAGSYRPASSFQGSYLLFDAASSSLSTIPGIRYKSSYTCAGFGTIIWAREGGAFVLSELLFSFSRVAPAIGMLCLWQSPCSSEQGQGSKWVYKVGRLPAEVPYKWRVHTSFSVQSRNLFCWVDLCHGLLLFNMEHVDSSGLKISFVPLPHNNEEQKQWPHPQDFRTTACVDGEIKYLTMHGFMEGTPISLVTYTLNLDGPSPSWRIDTVLHLDDLWADESFISRGVPRIAPMSPFLSTQEHDVVYLVIPGDVEYEEGYRVRRPRLLLTVDTRKIKVISSSRENCPETLLHSRSLLAFNASLNDGNASLKDGKPVFKYHQRAVEAIEMGASGKKMKV